MKSIFLSNKIFFTFLFTLTACGVQNTNNSKINRKTINGNETQKGMTTIVWDQQSAELTQAISSVTYRLNYKVENEDGELVDKTDLITLYPRDSIWSVWDIKPSNQLPQVFTQPDGKLLSGISYNQGFPLLTPDQKMSLKMHGGIDWIDPISLDTIKWQLDKPNVMSDYRTKVDGDSLGVKVFRLKYGVARMKVIPAENALIIAEITGLGYSYSMEEISRNPNLDDLSKPGVLAKNAVLHYTASSAEGVMNLSIRILNLVSDTIVCAIKGDVDDSYKYTFNNIVVYGGLAYTQPLFQPFLPSLILDSLFYKRDGMCFLSPLTLSKLTKKNGGFVGMDHFEESEYPIDDIDISAEIGSQVYMQYFRKGKKRDNVTIKSIYPSSEMDVLVPIEVFANYNSGCFLDIIPFNNVGVVYRASSTDMMWNIKLEYISYE